MQLRCAYCFTENTKLLDVLPLGFLLDELNFRLPNASQMFNAAATLPYVQPNAAFFFREKACDASSAASSHAPKKGCSLREVWRSQTCTSGSPFFCFEPVFIIRANRFCVIKAWIQGAKHSKVGYLASICNAVAMLLGRKSCRADNECRFTLWRSKEK